MLIQSLQEFQNSFSTKPVEVEITKDGQNAKDGTFSIYLKPLTSAERDRFEASIVGEKGKRNLANLRARLVANCWVNAEGKPVGTADEIGKQRADLIGAIFDKVREMNGMYADDVDEAGKD